MSLSSEEQSALRSLLRTQRHAERAVPWGFSYERDFILANPVPARCETCGYLWDGADAIRAPSLRNCSCFFCTGRLVALDQAAYAARLKSLHRYRIPRQTQLLFDC